MQLRRDCNQLQQFLHLLPKSPKERHKTETWQKTTWTPTRTPRGASATNTSQRWSDITRATLVKFFQSSTQPAFPNVLTFSNEERMFNNLFSALKGGQELSAWGRGASQERSKIVRKGKNDLLTESGFRTTETRCFPGLTFWVEGRHGSSVGSAHSTEQPNSVLRAPEGLRVSLEGSSKITNTLDALESQQAEKGPRKSNSKQSKNYMFCRII